MPIEMPKGLPFSVDTWNPCSKRKRHHFLSHAHKDHTLGISTHFSFPIYSSLLTKSLLLHHHPQLDDSLFVGIEVGQSLVIDDPDGAFTVMAFDANHCPGAVMFLFEGNFGNILHTGDCRLTPECLQNLPDKYLGRKGRKPRCQLDYVFLDCTFGRFSRKIPSKHSAIRQVINCIWKHPDATVVYLSCDLLGQEQILADVSQAFGSKIYVDKATNPELFLALTLIVPEIITHDPSSRFHVFSGFPELYIRAKAKLEEARANSKPEPLIIRPSTQWYAFEEGCSEDENHRKQRISEAVRDQFGVWHVCYSMHSSREELEWALQLLAPKWVISTTPSCRAMELNYVKKHCFSAQASSNDSLWKLLDLNLEASSFTDVSVKSVHCPPMLEVSTQSSGVSQLQQVRISTGQKEGFNLSPPSHRMPITLFGRARLGLQESPSRWEEKMVNMKDLSQDVDNRSQQESSFHEEENCAMTCTKPLVKKLKVEADEVQCDKPFEKESEVCKDNQSFIGSSKCFNERLRRLYRSMNVPVPEPLPSLVDLLKANKRAKR
ncbi:uncharacterized protein LOC107425632 isoform X1 [Ziziphus jujuba]|uniref:Uncharacterized protein LOC107425632 isoform X1 n=3 Tax=Ziziphus jujuba TaxID=326968 RepID=A0ABM4AEF4_ZIZJJ|nr:uncharacterized protein LOC107425632 isoform X1 [Ziziphus jujuba]KAH7520845.1 hypothetical protein FEM48_Zijuj08G0189100 [Ziziphus jujuba var. spinosa]